MNPITHVHADFELSNAIKLAIVVGALVIGALVITYVIRKLTGRIGSFESMNGFGTALVSATVAGITVIVSLIASSVAVEHQAQLAFERTYHVHALQFPENNFRVVDDLSGQTWSCTLTSANDQGGFTSVDVDTVLVCDGHLIDPNRER